MTDVARARETGLLHSAGELRIEPALQEMTWECLDCRVEMAPVAVDPGREFKVIPYFRCVMQHAEDCQADGAIVPVSGEPRRTPEGANGNPGAVPSRLRLVEHRLLVEDRERDDQDDDVARRTDGGQPGQAGREHDNVAGALHRIAEAYCIYEGIDRWPLSIPGCVGQTYGECFERLVSTSYGREYRRKVYYAEISFRRVEALDDLVEIALQPAFFTPMPDGRKQPNSFRVRFNTRDWTGRR